MQILLVHNGNVATFSICSEEKGGAGGGGAGGRVGYSPRFYTYEAFYVDCA